MSFGIEGFVDMNRMGRRSRADVKIVVWLSYTRLREVHRDVHAMKVQGECDIESEKAALGSKVIKVSEKQDGMV